MARMGTTDVRSVGAAATAIAVVLLLVDLAYSVNAGDIRFAMGTRIERPGTDAFVWAIVHAVVLYLVLVHQPMLFTMCFLVAAGLALIDRLEDGSNIVRLVYGDVSGSNRLLILWRHDPAWRALVVTSWLHIGVLGCLHARRSFIEANRRMLGCCVRCGFDRRGTHGTPCPECGWEPGGD